MKIRYVSRLSSWPTTSLDDLIETEFHDQNGYPDLKPSVYEVSESQVLQAFAEHATMRGKPSSAGAVDLDGTGRPEEPSPGKTGFAFTRDAHREIILRDEEDLRQLVGQARQEYEQRHQKVTREACLEYARQRLSANDPEWQAKRLAAAALPGSWLAKLKVK